MDKYASFVVTHAQHIAQVENGLNSITYVLPALFANSGLVTEILYVVTSLVTHINDGILRAAIAKNKLSAVASTISTTTTTTASSSSSKISLETPETRYRGAALRAAPPIVRGASAALTTLLTCQYLLEYMLRRNHRTPRLWRGILCIEALKATLRLVILGFTRRMCVVTAALRAHAFDVSELRRVDGEVGSRSGIVFPSSSSIHSDATADAVATEWQALADTAPRQVYSNANALLLRLTPRRAAGECMHIMRPVFYAALMLYASTRGPCGSAARRRWQWCALIVALASDVVSHRLLRVLVNDKSKSKSNNNNNNQVAVRYRVAAAALPALERSERERRRAQLVQYLFRGAAYNVLARPTIDTVVRVLKFARYIGGGTLAGVVDAWREHYLRAYFYTSAS